MKSIGASFTVSSGFRVEAAGAAVRVFVRETEEGGLYFELAAERGRGFSMSAADPQMSIIAIAFPAPSVSEGRA